MCQRTRASNSGGEMWMSSVSRPGKGETGKNIFHEGGHDEHQHDNADDANNTSAPHDSAAHRVVYLGFLHSTATRRRHRSSAGVLIDVTEQFDFGRVPDKI